MHLGHLLFQTHGRISRKVWWLSNIAIWLSSIATTVVFTKFGWHDAVFGLVLTVMLFWIRININIKRLHDRGVSGWWILFSEIPIIGWIYGFIAFGFLKGDEGENAHGEAST